MNKLKDILLIDDDYSTNFIHKKLIAHSRVDASIHVAHSGLEALQMLSHAENGVNLEPDIIFLDINMPLMNGWEFLDEYEKMDGIWIKDSILLMVSTSINPDDEIRSRTHPRVNDFVKKPLSKETVCGIFDKYFFIKPALSEI